jgi:hypothetical protein
VAEEKRPLLQLRKGFKPCYHSAVWHWESPFPSLCCSLPIHSEQSRLLEGQMTITSSGFLG